MIASTSETDMQTLSRSKAFVQRSSKVWLVSFLILEKPSLPFHGKSCVGEGGCIVYEYCRPNLSLWEIRYPFAVLDRSTPCHNEYD